MSIPSKRSSYFMASLAFFCMLVFATSCFSNLKKSDNTSSDSVSVHGFNNWPSADTSPVDIMMDGTHFRIPRNLMTQAYVDNNTSQASFSLLVHWPDYAGATVQTLDLFKGLVWTRTQDMVFIYVEQSSVSRFESATQITAEQEKISQHETRYGLKTWIDINRREYPAFYGVNQITHTPILIHCDTGVHNCDLYVDLPNSTRALVRFPYALLPKWQEIDTGMTNFLSSLVV